MYSLFLFFSFDIIDPGHGDLWYFTTAGEVDKNVIELVFSGVNGIIICQEHIICTYPRYFFFYSMLVQLRLYQVLD